MDSPSRSSSSHYRPKQPSLLARALSNQQNSPSTHSHSRSSTSSSSSASGSPASAALTGTGTFSTPPRRRSLYHPPSPASVTRGGSTIPFDFAGSERAAREARETPPKTGMGREIVPRKRVVRRKSLLQRATGLPSTLTDYVVFFSLNVDLDALARPLGLALALLQFFLRAPLWAGRQAVEGGRKSVLRASGSAGVSERGRWEGRFGDAPKAHRGTARWVSPSTILSLVLLLVAVLNALYLFSRTRSYRLQMRANPASVGSPNARVVDLDEPIDSNPFNGGGGGGGPSHEAEDGRGWIQKAKDGKVWLAGGRMLLPYLNPLPPLRYLLSLPPTAHPTLPRLSARTQAIQLSIWQPPAFALNLFAVFPPATSLILHAVVPHAPLAGVLCALVVGYSGERVSGMWERRGRDREVLGGEVLREYDQRFVYPNLFKQRKEVGVMTHEAEMVW